MHLNSVVTTLQNYKFIIYLQLFALIRFYLIRVKELVLNIIIMIAELNKKDIPTE